MGLAFISIVFGVFVVLWSPGGALGQTRPSGGTLQTTVERLPADEGKGQVFFSIVSASVNGCHWAYVCRQDNQDCVVLDGQAGPMFDKVLGFAYFSRDGGHIAYWAKAGLKYVPVVDGQAGEESDMQGERDCDRLCVGRCFAGMGNWSFWRWTGMRNCAG
jgi:hypothetical protein